MNYLWFLVFLLLSQTAFAQEEELVAAREGAPSHISDDAGVMVWKKGRYVKSIEGSNEFTCLVWADIKGTFEPSCLNNSAREAILPVYEFKRRMLEKGENMSEILDEIASRARKGEFLAPAPGAVIYMMSNRNKFFRHTDGKILDIEPHIMLYFPRLEASSLGFNGQDGTPSFYHEFPHVSVVHIHTGEAH